jgi:RNA-binding protein PNO1
MVAIQPEPTTSTARCKTRRSLQKKKKNPAVGDPTQAREYDQQMDDQEEEKASSLPIPTATETNDEDEEIMIDTDPTSLQSETAAPSFPPLPASALHSSLKSEMRRIAIPPHRLSPLKKDWINIFGPLTEILGLQVRMNVPRKSVEIRVGSHP